MVLAQIDYLIDHASCPGYRAPYLTPGIADEPTRGFAFYVYNATDHLEIPNNLGFTHILK